MISIPKFGHVELYLKSIKYITINLNLQYRNGHIHPIVPKPVEIQVVPGRDLPQWGRCFPVINGGVIWRCKHR